MHTANQFLGSVGKLAHGSVLTQAERENLRLSLIEDAKNYYQSAAVSLVDSLRSISSGFYSWSAVKLYYSVFYALRARLAAAGECIYYDSGKPRYTTVNPGFHAVKMNGNTHKQ